MPARLAILYEHPKWFEPLFAELRRQGIQYEEWKAERLSYDLEETGLPDLVLNRMSASAAFRGHGHGQFAVRDLLSHLESRRVAVINGAQAYEYEVSKVRQLGLFRRCGLRTPRTRVFNHPSLALKAAEGITFPVLVKPNCGGAGSGIRRFDSPGELSAASNALEMGCDHTALIQEFIPSRDGSCYRVEVLDGEVLYCVRIQRDGSGFNLCPADACESAAKPIFTRVEPPEPAATAAISVARLGKLDVCGIEYILDHRTGEPVFYDLNALSNFVTNAESVVGFNPTARFVEYLSRRLFALGSRYSG
jgi:glutathione synthase/RimK-type ligase-like ATP-grasp enzyme